MFEFVVFYSSAIILLLFALLTIKFNNIFYSLLSAIIVFFLTGVVFFLLHSEYNAVIQLAIYGFAIPITLGLTLMFTSNHKLNNQNHELINQEFKYVIYLFIGIFILSLFYLVITSTVIVPNSFKINNSYLISTFNNLDIFAKGIFSKYVLAFELLSIILTIIVIGLTIFKRSGK